MRRTALMALLLVCVLHGDAAGIKGVHNLRVGGPSAQACTLQVTDGETYNTSDELITGNWLACRFTTTSGFTICTVDLRLDDIPGNTDPLDVAIYTDDTDHPGVIVGSFSPTISSALVVGDAFYTFTPTATLSATTTYWLVFRAGDTDTGVIMPVDNSGEVGKDTMSSSDGTSWADQTANAVFNFRLNGQ